MIRFNKTLIEYSNIALMTSVFSTPSVTFTSIAALYVGYITNVSVFLIFQIPAEPSLVSLPFCLVSASPNIIHRNNTFVRIHSSLLFLTAFLLLLFYFTVYNVFASWILFGKFWAIAEYLLTLSIFSFDERQCIKEFTWCKQ